MQTIYITTSIPYVNARPHIGHALELVQADALARYYRLAGKQVVLQTGTDENAFKNVLAAKARGITTQELVDENSAIFRELTKQLRISADSFIRTTEARHKTGVNALWQKIPARDFYKKSYSGYYCNGCEDFLNPDELSDGKCPDHDQAPSIVEEENYFFRLSAYQAQLYESIESNKLAVIPSSRKNEVLAFIRRGLTDISVSRNAGRAGDWGIPVPGDPEQVIYVWIDALINYLSGIGYGHDRAWESIWNRAAVKIHVIGKNVWKFHAVYWPAMLLAAGLPLPDQVFVHGFLTVDGRKISKTLGNTVDPFDCIAQYGSDAVRMYLLSEISPVQDGDFSFARLKNLYNSRLANGIGNLVSRITTIAERLQWQPGAMPGAPGLPAEYCACLENYQFDKALDCVWQLVDALNRDVDRVKPWELLKNGNRDAVAVKLRAWVAGLYEFARLSSPFLPETSGRITAQLSGGILMKGKPLFPRVK